MNSLARYDDVIRSRYGARLIGGLDEAGRGALAGPVVVGAVVLGPGVRLEGVNDSKLLSPAKREALVPKIRAAALAYAVAAASPEEIESINILQATLLAADRALVRLKPEPEVLLTDYLNPPGAPEPMIALKKGDSTSLAIAAASILAKVARDRLMVLLDGEFPQYGFAAHKGYGTRRHLEALERQGPASVHRRTFAGVAWFGGEPSVHSRSKLQGRFPPEGGARPMRLLDDLLGPDHADLPSAAFLPDREFAVVVPV